LQRPRTRITPRANGDANHSRDALLRLAQGRIDAACAASRRLTSATSDRLRRAKLQPAHLEIMLSMGDVKEARAARDALRELAHAFDIDPYSQTISTREVNRAASAADCARRPLHRADR
jgi:hypothetical protein